MKNLTLVVLVQTFLLLSTAAYARRAEVVDPEAIIPPQGLSMEIIDKAIDGSLKENAWAKEKSTQGDISSVQAALHISSHIIKVTIEYTTDSILLPYLDSTNMEYKEKKGKHYIHPNYNVWTQALADQISANVALGDAYTYDPAAKPSSNVAKTNPPPSEAFSVFLEFRLEGTTLAEGFQEHKGNLSTQRNLDHNLGLTLTPKLETWSGKGKEDGRVLLIKPHIAAVRFVGTAARFWGGMMAGRSWIYVKVEFIDEASGKKIAEPELFRVARVGNGWSLAKNDYAMVEDMAADIADYVENNYENPVGGGVYPPAKFKQIALGNK